MKILIEYEPIIPLLTIGMSRILPFKWHGQWTSFV